MQEEDEEDDYRSVQNYGLIIQVCFVAAFLSTPFLCIILWRLCFCVQEDDDEDTFGVDQNYGLPPAKKVSCLCLYMSCVSLCISLSCVSGEDFGSPNHMGLIMASLHKVSLFESSVWPALVM